MSIEEVVRLQECEIFSYLPNMEDDPFSSSSLWSFNFFFVNKTLKRILYLTCICKSKFMPATPGGYDPAAAAEDYEEDIGDMEEAHDYDREDLMLGEWEEDA